MFYCLAVSLNFAFKWVSMFDLDQTFSPNILPYEQMLDRLVTSAKKTSASGMKQPIQTGIWVTSTYFFSGYTQKALCELTSSDVLSNRVCPFSYRTFYVTNTMLDENV